MNSANPSSDLTLITGATGFVGGRLLRALHGTRPLRCMVRDADRLDAPEDVEVVEADLADAGAVRTALEGVDCVFYLVHSMEPGDEGFAERDLAFAQTTARACAEAGVRRIVYLGGVRPHEDGSEHLRSRWEVEDTLATFGGEFVALRASMIVGAGSASFDTLVQLIERLPVLALPTWRDRLCQPIGIDDVVSALAAASEASPGRYDIAGADTLSFAEMIEQLGGLMDASRPTIDLPFTNSALESAAAALVTDQDRELLTPLMAGLDEDLVVEHNALTTTFGVAPLSFRDAASRALEGDRAAATSPGA